MNETTVRLSELGEDCYIKDSVLVVPCQGPVPMTAVGCGRHCCGRIRIPFSADPQPGVWQLIGEATLDNISLQPSIDAGFCGHFFIKNGEVRRTW